MRARCDPDGQFEVDMVVAETAKTNERFDVIIIDSTDPVGPGRVLFDPSFYQAAVACLTEQGVIVTHTRRAALGAGELKADP
jgi:Spermidine synthase